MARPRTIIDRIRQLFAGPPPEVDEEEQARLIGRLTSSDASVRVAAAEALSAYPTDAVGAALSKAVGDRDVRVREAAARSIRRIPSIPKCLSPP